MSTKPTLVLQKARQVLDVFTTAAPELTLGEIREGTGLPATTCTRLVHNLVDEGLLDRVEDRYRIGLAVLRWSAAALRGMDVVSVLTPVIEHLRDTTGESAGVYVRHDLTRTCVAVAPTRHAVIWQLQVGMVTPLHVGSGGRAILAFDASAVERVLATDRVAFTPHTLVDKEALHTELDRTVQTGVAISDQELDHDVAGVSAPVFGAEGTVIASVGVAGPTQRFAPVHIDEYIPAVQESARSACRRMGGAYPY